MVAEVKRKADTIPTSSVGKSFKKDRGVKDLGFLHSLKSLASIEKFKMADEISNLALIFIKHYI